MSNDILDNKNPTQVNEKATFILSNELESVNDSLLEVHPKESSDVVEMTSTSPLSERRLAWLEKFCTLIFVAVMSFDFVRVFEYIQ